MNKINNKLNSALESERLELNPITFDDTDLIYSLRSNDDVVKFTGIEKYISKDQAVSYVDKMISRINEDTSGIWSIKTKKDGIKIGSVCLWNFEPDNNRAEIGYDLLPEYWGKGYVPEAAKSVISFAFNELNLSSVIAVLYPEHSRSIAVLRKLGFSMEGVRVNESTSTMMVIYELKHLDADKTS